MSLPLTIIVLVPLPTISVRRDKGAITSGSVRAFGLSPTMASEGPKARPPPPSFRRDAPRTVAIAAKIEDAPMADAEPNVAIATSVAAGAAAAAIVAMEATVAAVAVAWRALSIRKFFTA